MAGCNLSGRVASNFWVALEIRAPHQPFCHRALGRCKNTSAVCRGSHDMVALRRTTLPGGAMPVDLARRPVARGMLEAHRAGDAPCRQRPRPNAPRTRPSRPRQATVERARAKTGREAPRHQVVSCSGTRTSGRHRPTLPRTRPSMSQGLALRAQGNGLGCQAVEPILSGLDARAHRLGRLGTLLCFGNACLGSSQGFLGVSRSGSWADLSDSGVGVD